MTRALEHLRQYIKDNNIVQEGNFKLSSGQITNTYFNCKTLLLDSTGVRLAIPLLLELLTVNVKFHAVGGMELGAVPIVGAMLMQVNNLKGFIVRKNIKEHGTQKFIEGPVEPGMKVAIVEDVMTTGKSAYLAYERAKEFGLEPVIFGSIINRQEGANELLKFTGLPIVYLFDRNLHFN